MLLNLWYMWLKILAAAFLLNYFLLHAGHKCGEHIHVHNFALVVELTYCSTGTGVVRELFKDFPFFLHQ